MLKGKTVVIDTSIYLYKFLQDDALMPNFKQFINLFGQYHIRPIFIFDGKPPPEKKALLIQRLLEKRDAEERYKALSACATIHDQAQLRELKKQSVRVLPEQIEQVKTLLKQRRVQYLEATGEADALCAYYLKTGQAWACFSDDMDLLVYENTTNIIRNVSIRRHTGLLYNKQEILCELQMSEAEFNQIMILSGTDYNIGTNTSLAETIRWYYEYKKYQQKQPHMMDDFYSWLHKHTKYITRYEDLLNTARMFQYNTYLPHPLQM